MKKTRIICALLITVLLFSSCSGKKGEKKPETQTPDDSTTQTTDTPTAPTGFINSLTGERTLETEAQTKLRPVAVSVNNLLPAQKVQTGLEKADIVYESYVEGGITRLLAVFKDLKSVKQVGTVRSARYVYAFQIFRYLGTYRTSRRRTLRPRKLLLASCHPFVHRLGV